MRGIEPFNQRRLLVSGLFRDIQLLQRVAPDLTAEMFDSPAEQWLAAFALRFYKQYRVVPSEDALALEIGVDRDAGRISEAEQENIVVAYRYMDDETHEPYAQSLLPLLREHAGELVQQLAIQRALDRARRDLDSGAIDAIVPRVQKAVAAGQPPVASRSLLLPAAGRVWLANRRATRQRLFGTGLPTLDERIGGGIHAGEIGVFLAATAVGKSHLLVHIGRHCLFVGLRVLHVTLELSQPLTEERYMAGFVGIRARDFDDQEGTVLERLDERLELTRGVVRVQYAAPLTVAQLRWLIDDNITNGDFAPEVLIVDYADELSSPSRREDQSWIEQGRVYSELRALAMDYGLPVWTAMQTNRDGVNARHLDLRSVGLSYEKAKIADLIVAMVPEPAQMDPHRPVIDMVPLKVRNAERGRVVKVVADYALSQFTEWTETDTAGVADDDEDFVLARRGGR